MAIRDNGFTVDSTASRGERLQSVSSNIDTYAAELGITGSRLTWYQDASDEWDTAVAKTITESGEKEDAVEDFNRYVDEVTQYYVAARKMMENIIYEYGGKPDEFIVRYGFKGESPRSYYDLGSKIKAWIDTDTKLKAMVPPDPRVAPDAVTTTLSDMGIQMDALYDAALAERSESDAAFAAKHELFAQGSYQLNILLSAATLVWGNDDPRLRLLGFCPKSEIWTEKKPPAPKDLAFDEGTFSWSAVEGADSYQLQYRISQTAGDWSTFYEGVETSTTEKPAEAGSYDIRVRAIAGEKLGAWSGVIEVVIEEVVK